MAKDRARPFSRKHRRYWITVTGGMIFVGLLNVVIGYCSYDPGPDEPPQKIEVVIPKLAAPDAGGDAVAPKEP